LKRIVKYVRLSRKEKKLFGRAILLLISWRIRLAYQSFERAARHNSQASAQFFASRPQSSPSQRIAALLDAAARIIPFSTCLSKALAGNVLFSSHGYKTKLHIGVSKENDGSLKAHAWLTLDDKIITGFVEDICCYKEMPLSQNGCGQ